MELKVQKMPESSLESFGSDTYCSLGFSSGYLGNTLKHLALIQPKVSHPPLIQFNNTACGCTSLQLFVILTFVLPPDFHCLCPCPYHIVFYFFFTNTNCLVCLYFPHRDLYDPISPNQMYP